MKNILEQLYAGELVPAELKIEGNEEYETLCRIQGDALAGRGFKILYRRRNRPGLLRFTLHHAKRQIL